MRLHHLAIKAVDLERVAAFYRDVLGLTERARHPHSVWLDCGDAILMIEKASRPGAPAPGFAEDPPGIHLLALSIDAADGDGWREKLAAAGHPVVHSTAWTLYVQDPEGNRVGLSWYAG